MDLTNTIMLTVWIVEASLCFIFSLFSLIIHYSSEKRRRAIFVMEIGAFVLLFFDVVALFYMGST